MKHFSLRSFLLLAVGVALAVNILCRFPVSSPKPVFTVSGKAETLGEVNILPSPSNLLAMREQWTELLTTLPPSERKQSAARLKEEIRFFTAAQFLPAEERDAKIRERLEGLMNDPGIQSDWAGERMKMIAGLTPETRREIMKQYVQSKKERALHD